MKTAGIVLRNFKNGLSELDFSSSDAFLKAGYPFEEVRLLSRKDREAFLKAAEGACGRIGKSCRNSGKKSFTVCAGMAVGKIQYKFFAGHAFGSRTV